MTKKMLASGVIHFESLELSLRFRLVSCFYGWSNSAYPNIAKSGAEQRLSKQKEKKNIAKMLFTFSWISFGSDFAPWCWIADEWMDESLTIDNLFAWSHSWSVIVHWNVSFSTDTITWQSIKQFSWFLWKEKKKWEDEVGCIKSCMKLSSAQRFPLHLQLKARKVFLASFESQSCSSSFHPTAQSSTPPDDDWKSI